MVFDVSVSMTWILFLALFPMAFIWLRRALRILLKRNFSEVALKRGESPSNPAKYAPYAAMINLLAGVLVSWVIINILMGWMSYASWSAIAGTTIWLKLLADFILSRHAHPPQKKTARAAD